LREEIRSVRKTRDEKAVFVGLPTKRIVLLHAAKLRLDDDAALVSRFSPILDEGGKSI
jgi:hypothetical protein